jgi:hypothetical protein
MFFGLIDYSKNIKRLKKKRISNKTRQKIFPNNIIIMSSFEENNMDSSGLSDLEEISAGEEEEVNEGSSSGFE